MAAGARDHCRALVEAGDPDRALVTRGAGADRLWPLWAFNLEVARAPWASREPMVAEIRLQFWADAAAALGAGRAASAHPVIGPLAQVLPAGGAAVLAALVEARRRDVWREPFADPAALEPYLEATAAGLMWVAAGILGAEPAAEPAVRAHGWAAGLAAWLQAVPQLQARGWTVLPEPAETAALARAGLARIAAARAARGTVPAAAFPALATGWQAEGILKRALADPGRVAAGALAGPEVARRGGLLWKGLTGRW